MAFSSLEFFVFFAVVLTCLISLWSVQKRKKIAEERVRRVEHYILLVSSYVFYGWWDWRFCILMFIMTYIAFFCARRIESSKNNTIYRIVGIGVPLIVLGIFKYANFFVDSFLFLVGAKNRQLLNIILPVGISFYTFQSLSYTVDVMRGKLRSHDFLSVALYISFFPQLVAGPIVKAADFLPQLEKKNLDWKHNIHDGVQIFAVGLFKKIVIADNLSVFVDDVFSKPEIFSAATIVLAIVAYSIQIYFDFSGYSDMAVGSAKCMGYEFNRNFNLPYISKNVSEFWKRWHISLSSWLQEYLYIPLGGNRKGNVRTYVNLMLTMILGGLWHGANATFVMWGLLHGLALCVHKVFKKYGPHRTTPSPLWSLLSIILTYCYVCFCWIFFRAETFTKAFSILRAIFTWQSGVIQIYSWAVVAIALLLAVEFIAFICAKKNGDSRINGFYFILNLNNFWERTLFFIFCGLIIGLAYTGISPFIYFQF